MKLLMTTDTVGGVWTYTMELCAALHAYDVRIELASLGRKLSAEQWADVGRLPHVRVHESEYRLCWMHDPWRDVERSGEWLLELEQELEPDLVQLNDLGHGGLNWQSPVVLVGHSCVYSWWAAVKRSLPAPGEWSHYHAVVRTSVQRADWVVAPSRAMLESLLYYYGPARVSMVIPNGRSYPPLTWQRSRPRAAVSGMSSIHSLSPANSGTKSAEPIIFAAGRIWDEAKNIAALISIAEHLPGPVYLAGECLDPGGAGDNAQGEPSRVRYLGFLNKTEMANWLQRASIYVAPAHYEPFGLGILEAARVGCALVLGDIPSLREVWADAAEYVSPDDPGQLQRAIARLAANPNRRGYLAGRAWQRAQVYSATRMASDYMQCYRTLVRNGAALLSQEKTRGIAGAKP